MTLPTQLGEVTPDWLTAMLQPRFPGVAIRSIEVLRTIQGTGTKLSLQLTYSRSAGAPERMWLKTGFAVDHLEKMNALGLYAREAQFYGEVLPRVSIKTPDCYGTRYDLSSGRGAVLLENLDRPDVSFPGYQAPLSVDMVADGLTSLAGLHGQSWQKRWLNERGLSGMFAPGSAQERHFQSYAVSSTQAFLDGPVGQVVPVEVRDAQRVHNALWKLQSLYRREPLCLQHTDTHPGNIYLDGTGRVGFLDWQFPSIGPWAHDVSYWIVSSLSFADRRDSERLLLKDYLGRLGGHGVHAPPFDQAWLDYRRFIAYGYWVWLRNPPTMQPLENNVALSARFGPAMADHDVFGLLGV